MKCNCLDVIRTVSRFARKACEEGFFWTEVVFLIKIFNFYQKNNFGPIDFLLARLFLCSKKTVRKECFYLFRVPYQLKKMDSVNQIVLWSHIAAGFTGLMVGSIPIFVEKGSRLHKQSGVVFYWAMAWVSVSALWLVAFKHANPFLLGISVFSFYNAYSGRRILAFKNTETQPSTMDWAMLSALTVNGLSMVFSAAKYAYLAFADAWGIAILYAVFGLFCLQMAREDYQFYEKPESAKRGKMQWFFGHFARMLGAYIATWTAFAVVNFSRLGLPDGFDLVAWLLPGVLGGFGIARWTKIYVAKFKQ